MPVADDSIRPAVAADVDDVVAVLTVAFHDDPLMVWAWPDPQVRPRRLDALWSFMAGDGYIPRWKATIVPGGDGAALWTAPGEGLDEEFWTANVGRFIDRLEGDVERLGSISDVMDANHPHDREHWYLLSIGVSPAAQGRRLGSAMLAHTLAQVDAGQAPAYLEATTPRSRALYERFGFETLAQVDIPDGPPIWPMWREPSAGAR
jgi:ribosomal protein S18 acetylase RimI-like enzyme